MSKKENDEYIKFMTERLVHYIEMPQEVRKDKRKTAKALREPWLTRWFGVGAFGLVLWLRGKNERTPELISTDIRDNSLME
jgi:hypothetical protein